MTFKRPDNKKSAVGAQPTLIIQGTLKKFFINGLNMQPELLIKDMTKLIKFIKSLQK